MADSEQALLHLRQAHQWNSLHEWTRARACASAAIEADPALSDAYLARAHAVRLLGDVESAIADLTRAVALAPQKAAAWRGLGACRAQQASATTDRKRALELLDCAHEAYTRAAHLDPRDEWAGLDLLELQICLGRYREAVATTGAWWPRIQECHNKLICAWLGGVALALAGKPEQKWAHFREYVQSSSDVITPDHWMIEEIDCHLNAAETLTRVSPKSLAGALELHRAFLKHYERK